MTIDINEFLGPSPAPEEDWYEADGLDDLEELLAGEPDEPGLLSRAWATVRRKPEGYLEDRQLYREAKQQWWDVHREDVAREEPDDLPGYDIEVDGTTYHVRGVVHGGKRVMTASDEVCEFVADRVQQYALDGRVKVEQNIPDAMGFDDVVDRSYMVEEMDDVEWAADQDPFGVLKMGLSRLPKAVAAMPLIKLAQRSDSDSMGVDLMETMMAGKNDIERFDDIFDATEAYNMPYEIEADFFEEYRPTDHLIKNERSMYQAAEAVRAKAEDVYLVVGMDHVPQIGEKVEEFAEDGVPSEYRGSYSVKGPA